jgi:hypothetical protein
MAKAPLAARKRLGTLRRDARCDGRVRPHWRRSSRRCARWRRTSTSSASIRRRGWCARTASPITSTTKRPASAAVATRHRAVHHQRRRLERDRSGRRAARASRRRDLARHLRRTAAAARRRRAGAPRARPSAVPARAARRAPLGGVHVHLYSIDLARANDGSWTVHASRADAPTGLGYALENRVVVSQTFPELFGELGVQRLAHVLSPLSRRGRRVSRAGARPPCC